MVLHISDLLRQTEDCESAYPMQHQPESGKECPLQAFCPCETLRARLAPGVLQSQSYLLQILVIN